MSVPQYHVQAKDGFQFLCLNSRFSKIRSRLVFKKWACHTGGKTFKRRLYT